jgi:NADPH-dependent curcumin reductase CurA
MKQEVRADMNRQVVLKARPAAIPQASDFQIVQTPVPEAAHGQVLVRNIYLSVEPAMRGWVSVVANYAKPVALGEVMRSFAVGRVVESRHPGYLPGDCVTGLLGWQDYAAIDASAGLRKIEFRDLPMSAALGVLGINGATAHYGLLKLGEPRPGETVVVSTAAGAVGSCVGQIAKIMGSRAVGITGGQRKVRLCIDEFGFDAAVDYKSAEWRKDLEAACPHGVDVYFDNTAGPVSDAVMPRLNLGARIVVCGTAAVSSWDPPPAGPRVERHLLVKRARMQGFVIFDHADQHEAAYADIAEWIRQGRVKYVEDILDGMERAPDAIAGLYRGENFGKRLVRIAPDH